MSAYAGRASPTNDPRRRSQAGGGCHFEAEIRTGDGWQPGVQFAVDSPLEGSGFELSVPRKTPAERVKAKGADLCILNLGDTGTATGI
jgi:hypothetical protein